MFTRFFHLTLPIVIEISSNAYSSLHSGHVGSAAGSNKWVFAFRSGACPDRSRARRTASTLLEVATQSVSQDKCSYIMAVRGLLDGGSVMVRRMRAFAVANEMKPQAGDDLRVLWTQESGVLLIPIGISYVLPQGHMFQSRAQRLINGPKKCIRKNSAFRTI